MPEGLPAADDEHGGERKLIVLLVLVVVVVRIPALGLRTAISPHLLVLVVVVMVCSHLEPIQW